MANLITGLNLSSEVTSLSGISVVKINRVKVCLGKLEPELQAKVR